MNAPAQQVAVGILPYLRQYSGKGIENLIKDAVSNYYTLEVTIISACPGSCGIRAAAWRVYFVWRFLVLYFNY